MRVPGVVRNKLAEAGRCRSLRTLAASCLVFIAALPVASEARSAIEMVERFVPHESTAPANRGENVGLYLREKWSAAAAERWAAGATREGRVVLFVHGGIVSSIPDFDLAYRDYSWMDYLAAAGFDVFAMDHTGYGRSPRPTMDDPCNLGSTDQARVMPNALDDFCEPSYAGPLTTRESDWDELETMIDYIRELRGVERVSLIGWSLGGPRAGGYAARNPDKVDRLFLFSPAYSPTGAGVVTAPSVPMRLLGYDMLSDGRWQRAVACANQVDPAIRPVIWDAIMAVDPVGARWGAPQGLMRLRTSIPEILGAVAWDQEGAGRIAAPTMIVTGAQDNPDRRRRLYDDLRGTQHRVLAIMTCATHYAHWEQLQYRFLHRASLEWLTDTTFAGATRGVYEVGIDGADPRPAP